MITDEMLKEAAGELEAAMMAQLPEETECDHEFSAAFERKMKKVTHRANHPFAAKFGRQVAAAVLALVLLGGALLGISPAARAVFVGWVKEAYGTAVHYFIPESVTEKPAEEVPTAYHLGWVPEGYTLLDILESATNVGYVYVNAEGRLLYFDYTIPKKNASVDSFLEVKNHNHKFVFVGELQADLYINNDKNGSNALIWVDKSGTVLFCVMGMLEGEMLIKLAEDILPGKLDLGT